MSTRVAIALLGSLLLLACGSSGKRGMERAADIYDLGLPPIDSIAAEPWAIALEVRAGPGLEGNGIRYRLAYAEAERVREYSLARWAAPVADLLSRRLSADLGASTIQGKGGAPCILRVELGEFAQVFRTSIQSEGLVAARLSLLGRSGELASVSLTKTSLAPTPNAAGGVNALVLASDQLAFGIHDWLKSLPQNAKAACSRL